MKLPHSLIIVDWGLPADGVPFWQDSNGATNAPGGRTGNADTGGVAALKSLFTQYQINCLVTFEGFEDVSNASAGAAPEPAPRRYYGIVRNRSIFNVVVRKDTYHALRAAMLVRRMRAVDSGQWRIEPVVDGTVARRRNLDGTYPSGSQGILTSEIPFLAELGVFEDTTAQTNPFSRPVLGKARTIAKLGLAGGPSTQWGRGAELTVFYDRGRTVQLKLELEYDRL